ncbi:YciI family protein [Bradyrhizobium sp. LMG 9283]|uniref:YciI family protein n=1 Tax=Bradyrhizobium sp. LMG 9283 TaxID=592064 RepID=UPI003890D1A9
MHFIIYCLDDSENAGGRDAHYPAHNEYYRVNEYFRFPPVKLLIAGPMTTEDGKKRIGSMLLIEANSLTEAIDFTRNDPFHRNGVWKTVSIRPFLKTTDNR